MVIADTTVWVDYFRGLETPQTIWLRREMVSQPLGLTDLILCEVLQGIRRNESVADVLLKMQQFSIFNTGGRELAIAAAENYRILRSSGHTIRKTIDCVIATFCIRSGFELLHNDRDFDPFEELPGLRVIHPPDAK